jgi:hypothetical protein
MKRQNKYNKKSTVQICLRLNKKTDPDIIEYIELLKKNNISVNGMIKMSIRNSIKTTASMPKPLNLDSELDKFIEECKEIVKKYGGENSGGNK